MLILLELAYFFWFEGGTKGKFDKEHSWIQNLFIKPIDYCKGMSMVLRRLGVRKCRFNS